MEQIVKEKVKYKSTKSGLFNHETLTVSFGGPLSKPHNVFTANAIKCPDYSYFVNERECLGGGWYGGMGRVEKEEKNEYLIHRDGVFIGMMYPYPANHRIKSRLLQPEPIPPRILELIKENGLTINPDLLTTN